MKRYVGKFINPAGQSCRVNVYDDNYTGEAVELYMSPTPIVISESAQDLLTEPIMASSAVLTFISDPALEGLVVEDEMQCAVEVLADDTLVWHGYLNPEVRDDLLPSITSEVTLNATSTLGLMSTRKISAEGEPLRSIAQYIVEALQACGNVLTDICLPSVAKVTEKDGYNSLWTLQAQRDNFYTREEITSTDDELYDEQSWADVLSNFLTLFGLTIYEDYASGCIMLLSRDADATYCRMTLADFAAGAGAENYALPDSADMASLPMWGTSHSTSNYRPYSSVKVTSQVNAVEDTLFSLDKVVGAPAIEGSGYRVGMVDIGDTNPTNESVREMCSGGIRQIDRNLRVYKPSTEDKDYARIESFNGLSRADVVSGETFGLVSYVDIWLLGAIPLKGGIGQRNSQTQFLSFDPAFDPMLFVSTSVAWPQHSEMEGRLLLPGQTELIRVENKYSYGSNWGMSIDLELQSWYTDYQYFDFLDPLELILRVGDVYWNGKKWQSEEASFTPRTKKEGGVRITEDECQDVKYYTNLKGILIPHTESDNTALPNSGIGLMLSVRLHKNWNPRIPAFIIKKCDLKISPDLRTADRDAITGEPTNEYVYRKIYKKDGNNPLEIDLEVQGYHGELLAKSCLLSPSGDTITGLDYGEKTEVPEVGIVAVSQPPEDWLANHLKSIYCRSRKRYKLTVEGIDYKTNTRYNYEDITYTTVARSVDLYNNTTNIVLERATKNANL